MEKSSREIARGVRAASLKLRVLPTAKRTELLERLADLVEQRLKEILEANAIDVQNAQLGFGNHISYKNISPF